MKIMKQIFAGSLSLCLMLLGCGTVPAEAASGYEVIFRAGSHGSFSTDEIEQGGLESADDSKVVYRLELQTPNREVASRASALTPVVAEGYVFTGYEIELNDSVTEKTTYVAKYRRVADGVQYTVRYMDRDGNEISSPIVGVANLNSEILLYARSVDGYELESSPGARVTLTADGQEIVFRYRSTAEGTTTNVPTTGTTTTITIPGDTTTVTVPGAATATTTTTATTAGDSGTDRTTDTEGSTEGTAGSTGDNVENTEDTENAEEAGETVTIPEEEIPLAEGADEEADPENGSTEIEDEAVPLAEAPQELSGGISPVVAALGGAGLVCLIAAGILLYLKKRKNIF